MSAVLDERLEKRRYACLRSTTTNSIDKLKEEDYLISNVPFRIIYLHLIGVSGHRTDITLSQEVCSRMYTRQRGLGNISLICTISLEDGQ